MKLNMTKEIERARQVMKSPKKEVKDARTGLIKLHEYIIKQKEEGLELKQILEKLNEEFENELHKYFEVTGLEEIIIEDCALKILKANPIYVDEIYDKIKDNIDNIDIKKERYKLRESQKSGFEYEIESILKGIRNEPINQKLLNRISGILNSTDREIQRRTREYIKSNPDFKDTIEYSKIFLEESERKKVEKCISYKKDKTEETIVNTQKQCMKLAGQFLKKYNFLQNFLDLQNEDYRELDMKGMQYKLKAENENDIGLEDIFDDKYLDTISAEELFVLNAFWQNRYTKVIDKIKKAIFIADNLGIWEELEKSDCKYKITNEQILNCILKMKVVDAIYKKVCYRITEYEEEEHYQYALVNIDDMLDRKFKTEYKEYFDKILPECENDISMDFSINQYSRNSIKAIYEEKNNMIMKLLMQIESNPKITNWGYIPEGKKNVSDSHILLGIDYPGFNVPLKLHTKRKDLVEFLNMYKNSSVVPIYEGSADIEYRGKKQSSKIFMPLTQDRESEIIQKNKNLSPVDLRYNYIRQLGNLITKKVKKISKMYPHEYIDLSTGKKGIKINGKFTPYEMKTEKENLEK